MGVAATMVVSEVMVMATISDLLKPTKGDLSYPQIATRIGEWFRKQREMGRLINQAQPSPETIRRIYEGYLVNPNPVYLEALAAVQGVELNELLAAAGYPCVSVPDPDPVRRVEFALNGVEELKDYQVDMLKDYLEKLREKK